MVLSIGQTVLGKQCRGAVWSGSTLFAILSASFGCIALMLKPPCSSFRMITTNPLGVPVFRILTVLEGQQYTTYFSAFFIL